MFQVQWLSLRASVDILLPSIHLGIKLAGGRERVPSRFWAVAVSKVVVGHSLVQYSCEPKITELSALPSWQMFRLTVLLCVMSAFLCESLYGTHSEESGLWPGSRVSLSWSLGMSFIAEETRAAFSY